MNTLVKILVTACFRTTRVGAGDYWSMDPADAATVAMSDQSPTGTALWHVIGPTALELGIQNQLWGT
jgi:hypothetical protein